MTRSEFHGDTAQHWAASELLISPETLDRLGVVVDQRRHFADLGCETDALVFQYPGDAWKARSTADEAYASSDDLRPAFWNLEPVLQAISADPTAKVYVVQGELNACALVEAGVASTAVLSIPRGLMRGDAAARFDFVRSALKAGLAKAITIVWCGDQDDAGLTLRTHMARLVGPARFAFIDWPEGAHEALDVLRANGPEELLDVVANGSLPWPVAGLYRISELPDPPPLTLWLPGFPEWESKVHLAPRNLSVVTGHPGHGKTLLWGQIWFQIAKAYDLTIACASFETRPKPHMRRQLRSLFCGRLERDLTADEIREADAWIEAHYRFMIHPEQRPTLGWLLDMAEIAVIREGARVIQVDPWNRLESSREPRESETDYIGRCLRALHAFAHDMNVHVQILAHPAKMDGVRRGHAPTLEDISGSKNWDNAVDQGFVVHRDEIFTEGARKTEATLYCRKARFEELGFPCTLELDFDLNRGTYKSVDYERRSMPSKPRRGGSS